MTTITLGPGCSCDLDALINSRLLVQANSGGGKSWALRRLLEQSHGKVQQLIIDPEGEFATLREKHDYIYAAKQEGDTSVDPRAAKLLAHLLLETSVSAILDIYELKAKERVVFVRRFLEALVDAPKRLWHPVLVVVDEAHVYCPQRGEAESAGAVSDLCTRGRKRGFCAILATQRLSKLHKDAAAELNNKLIGRTGLDVDVKRAAEELGFASKEDNQQLRRLLPGEFFSFGPALSTEVTRVKVGGVRTTHPQAGARIASSVPPPTAKVKKLLPQFADLPAEAEKKARTVADLEKALRERDRQIRQLERAQPEPKVERVEVPVEIQVPMLRDEEIKQFNVIQTILTRVVHELATRPPVAALYEPLRDTSNGKRQKPPVSRTATRTPSRTPARQVVAPLGDTADKREDITRPQQRVLDALAWWEAVGYETPSKIQVGFVAKYRVGKSVGGTFGNILGTLRSQGLIEYPAPGDACLTDEGRQVAERPDIEPTTDALQNAVFQRLADPESRVLMALITAYPDRLSKQECGATAGYTVGPNVGGTFGNILGRLRSLGLIDYPSPGYVIALPVLFLEGA